MQNYSKIRQIFCKNQNFFSRRHCDPMAYDGISRHIVPTKSSKNGSKTEIIFNFTTKDFEQLSEFSPVFQTSVFVSSKMDVFRLLSYYLKIMLF